MNRPPLTYGDILTITVTVQSHGLRHSFPCPACGSLVKFDNKYPVGWDWKVCPSCRVQWVREPSTGIGPHVEWDDVPEGAQLQTRVLHGAVRA
jgi:hypothetical protein